MSNTHDEICSKVHRGWGLFNWRFWSSLPKSMVALLVMIPIVSLAVGLGVGLGVGLRRGGEGKGSKGPTTTTPPPTISENQTTATAVKWQPEVGTTWQIELLYPLNDTSFDVDVYDIDMFDNDASRISDLHGQGRKVICYFSAGSYENWRPDADKFKDSDLGNTLDGWPNEKWLKLNSSNVREIMLSRLDLAKGKGCDGVDPDNVDGYDNDNGLDLTEDHSVDFVNFLAEATHALNMSLGLKNSGAIIPKVIGNMQWSVNEQCVQYNECSIYAAFTDVGKPVFHIEYPKGDNTNNNKAVTTAQKNTACNNSDARNFSTVIKNMDLDSWIQAC
ncbi:glycoside hydrolase superfamily [Lipomyces orientalis]|uniref:Glycoside hydrolase superfamily n=1 Tax=Lipomyces orientalis TaxID=1233043 RepID=A0ACC3TFW7_9ASCO